MANLTKVTVGGVTYTIVDAQARAEIQNILSQLTGGMRYIGTCINPANITSDGVQTPVYIKSGKETDKTAFCYYTGTKPTETTYSFGGVTYNLTFVELKAGDTVISGQREYVFSDADSRWHEFGSTGSLKALAFKDNASGTIKPKGTVGSTFKGTAQTVTHTVSSSGSVSAQGDYTPEGTVAQGSQTKGTFIKSYPGAKSKLDRTNIKGVTDTTKTASKANASTINGLTAKVSGETLILTAESVSFSDVVVPVADATAKTVATGTLSATGTGGEVMTGLGTATTGDAVTDVANPTFTGKAKTVSVTGTNTGVKIADHSITPGGTVTSTFTGTQETVTVS